MLALRKSLLSKTVLKAPGQRPRGRPLFDRTEGRKLRIELVRRSRRAHPQPMRRWRWIGCDSASRHFSSTESYGSTQVHAD
jgi:hypothetical protein